MSNHIFAEYLEILRGLKNTETRLSDIIDEHVEQVCGKDYETTTSATFEDESDRFTVYYRVYCADMGGTVIITPVAFSYEVSANTIKTLRGSHDLHEFSIAWLLRSLDKIKTKHYNNKEDAIREIIVTIKRLLRSVCEPKISINPYSFDSIVIIDIKCNGYRFEVEAYRTTKMEIYGVAVRK